MKAGQQAGKYVLLREVGKGGFGTVYKGRSIPLGKVVAIKTNTSRDPNFRRNIQLQSNIASKLLHQNCIVPVFDLEQGPEHDFAVMEYIPRSLEEELKKGALRWDLAVNYISRILYAVEAVHSLGVVHRDLKPSNVLKNRYFTKGKKLCNFKLTDFGLAKVVEDELSNKKQGEYGSGDICSVEISSEAKTYSKRVGGTEEYMAPEQRQGITDKRNDIYSAGVIFYRMLTGKLPQGHYPARPSELNKDIPSPLDEVCAKALTSIERRYQTAAGMISDLKKIKQKCSSHQTLKGKYVTNQSSVPQKQLEQVCDITIGSDSDKKSIWKKTKTAVKYAAAGAGVLAGIAGLGAVLYASRMYLAAAGVGFVTGGLAPIVFNAAVSAGEKRPCGLRGIELDYAVLGGAIAGLMGGPAGYGIESISGIMQQNSEAVNFFASSIFGGGMAGVIGTLSGVSVAQKYKQTG